MTDAVAKIAAIAAKLSLEQRRALLRHSLRGAQYWGGRSDAHLPNWSEAGSSLRNRWFLIDFISPTSSLTKLTPLGLAVRAKIESGESE
jgi:hypothetical protein